MSKSLKVHRSHKKKKATTFDLQHQTDTPEGLEYLPKGNILTCVIGLLMMTCAQAQSGCFSTKLQQNGNTKLNLKQDHSQNSERSGACGLKKKKKKQPIFNVSVQGSTGL